MKPVFIYLMIVVMIVCICSLDATAFGIDQAKLTIRVVDEFGTPIENARVGIGFEVNRRSENGTDENPIVGLSDMEGKFTGSAACNGYVGFNVSKDGYYLSKGSYRFSGKNFIRWQPWNPEVEVPLRKIENPVPMYARNTKGSRVVIPVKDKEVGFDLIEFDWLPPYGRGNIADIEVLLKSKVDKNNPRNYKVQININFPGEFNGIQSVEDEPNSGSVFKLSRHAPQKGYDNKIEIYRERSVEKGIKSSSKKDKNYYFRVRSEIENRKLIKAMYGKILGDFSIGGAMGTAALQFKYYLNPDYTSNLEFDPEQNLFGDLPPLEEVGIY